jgi:dipeptidyl aminopeptidase/acylaminoacyl peptidase
MPRALEPADVARFRTATDPRLSPDGATVAFVVATASARRDDYRHAIWLVPVDGSAPARQVTIGARHDHHPRFSPDGRSLAFLSDRRSVVEDEPGAPDDREDGVQVHLLPLDGGEARRITDLPRGVEAFAWSPDGRRLAVLSTSHGATRDEDARRRGKAVRRDPGSPPESDYRYVDRLRYRFNGAGFVHDKVAHIWIVDVGTGEAARLTKEEAPEGSPAWSPDGSRIAFVSDRRRDRDLASRLSVYVRDLETGRETRVAGGHDLSFDCPAWMPDGRTVAVLGGRFPESVYRFDVWLFAADGSDGRHGGRNLSGEHDLMPGSTVASDLVPAEPARLIPSSDGRGITFTAPIEGSYEAWRIDVATGLLERLTAGRHVVSAFDEVRLAGGGDRIVLLRSTATSPADVHVADVTSEPVTAPLALRPLTELNRDLLAEVAFIEPVERRYVVDGREIQGWLIPAGAGAQPLVTEIHGGPHTLYAWAPGLELQVLAGAGMSVFTCNPRGSEGYGRAFNEANRGDWGDGPMRDVLAGIDGLVADGLADPDRLGVTGGSYGGYLTTWIVGHDDRFRAAITCRSVSDMGMLFLTSDIAGGDWPTWEFGRTPWEDPDYFRSISPITYADRIRTPLLIQHAEDDLRTPVSHAEALFTVLRSRRRPVRLMRVPGESHELTRSGKPFRRAENLVQVRDWFRHFLVAGKKGLPPLPKIRGDR